MPLLCEPGIELPIWLDFDADKQPRPTFFVRALSMRDAEQLATAYDAIFSSDNPAEINARLLAILSRHVIRWEHISRDGSPVAFSAESFADILTTSEALELARKVLGARWVSPDEKKSSESPG